MNNKQKVNLNKKRKKKGDNYYFRKSGKKWRSKPKKERTFGKIEYELPTKKVGNKYFQLTRTYSYNTKNPRKGYDDVESTKKYAREIYGEKKADKVIKNFRIVERKGRIEVWANYG